MLITISPAKKLDMEPTPDLDQSRPDFRAEAEELAGYANGLGVAGLQKLMKISENLARLNADRFANFGEMETKQAVMAFAGDTYQGLEARTLDADALAWAQDHLRILSGLYGVLRPLDMIEPYRLEMGSRLATPQGKSLYDYWGSRISQALNAQAKALGSTVLLNCASQEYFGAVDRAALSLRIITPVFKEDKDGQAKIVSFHAKRARGAMARYVIERRLTDPDALKEFDAGGYGYRADLSSEDEMVFTRPG
ncbi:peroxide stress protein YaaA [Roseovarius sp. CH_XMU1461]|uniref:peroxide stress protein YaaA n=1 Tax=Roseovarius sp. CH_XMU1461 TaxID=3107777 RepID=UPI0030081039